MVVVVSELVSCVGVILVVIVEVTDTFPCVSKLDEATGTEVIVVASDWLKVVVNTAVKLGGSEVSVKVI